MVNANYVLKLGNLYKAKYTDTTGIQSENIDRLIKSVLREMYNSIK